MESIGFGEEFDRQLESNQEVESDQETLEQKEEIIELPFSPEDFELFREASNKFKEKTEGDSEKFRKAWDFALELKDKYGKDASHVALFHIISGSTIPKGLEEDLIKEVDFEGEDSIVDFIEKL